MMTDNVFNMNIRFCSVYCCLGLTVYFVLGEVVCACGPRSISYWQAASKVKRKVSVLELLSG